MLDRTAWLQAGGDPQKLEVYASIGMVAPFSDGGDRCLATVHPATGDKGAIGDWVGGPDVLAAAEAWLREQGCRVARGPLELSTWFPFGANLGPFDDAPYALEPTERADRWQRAGYAVGAHYVSAVIEHDAAIGGTMDRAAALSASGWKLEQPLGEPPVSEGAFRAVIHLLHSIFARSASGDDGYVHVPVEALEKSYAPLRKHADPRIVTIARAPNGEPAGILFAIPDYLAPDRGWFLAQNLAVLSEHRQAGVAAWLLAATHQAARRAGYSAGVHCMMRTRAQTEIRRGRLLRRYAILEKPL